MIRTIPAVAAVTDEASQGKRLYGKIYILAEEDVDYGTLPTITESESARTMSALTLKSGATGWKEFNFAKYTPAATSEGSNGDITSSSTNTVTGTLAGESVEIDNFIQTVGRPVFIVTIDRFTMEKTIYGRPYSPMFFSSFNKRKNADNTSCDVNFTQESLFQPLKYTGDVVPNAGGDGDGAE